MPPRKQDQQPAEPEATTAPDSEPAEPEGHEPAETTGGPEEPNDAPVEAPVPEAPFGWDVLGEDGRRIARWQPEQDARQLAHQINAATGEEILVAPSAVR